MRGNTPMPQMRTSRLLLPDRCRLPPQCRRRRCRYRVAIRAFHSTLHCSTRHCKQSTLTITAPPSTLLLLVLLLLLLPPLYPVAAAQSAPAALGRGCRRRGAAPPQLHTREWCPSTAAGARCGKAKQQHILTHAPAELDTPRYPYTVPAAVLSHCNA